MERKKRSVKTFIAVFLVLIFFMLLMAAFALDPVIRLSELQKKKADLEKELSLAKVESEKLMLEVEKYKSARYVEIEARKRFGLVMPDESAFVLIKDDSSEVD
ncbi:MAG: septum formation initiator family protein [Actinobacteria bacterium]|nr:septum formation initiator family protein [Actinomycetota bacterium]